MGAEGGITAASCLPRRTAFTLIELLVVVAIIALLLSILLPSLAVARGQSRMAVCSVHLRQIGVAGIAYADGSRRWLAGSPNTSGNGARAGFGFENGNYTPTSSPDHYPALHVFDWANPLLPLLGVRPPIDFARRYAAAVGDMLCCPSNRREAGPVNFPPLNRLIPDDAIAPSYATSRYFTYVGDGAQTGEIAGTLWWHDDCVPSAYVPKLDRIHRPANKALLADAHVVSKTKGQIANANWGFTSHGAWRSHDEAPVTYRGSFLRDELWRHRGAINILAFDGHVERQPEGDGRGPTGLGTGARRASWWFPSGTDTDKLPSKHASEPALIVP